MNSSDNVSFDPDVQGIRWEGHLWSQWYTLGDAIASYAAKAPDSPGLYRIQCADQTGLIYIGQTGKSLRGRFRQLRKAMEYASQGKYSNQGRVGGPPHVAGGCVLKHALAGSPVEISWATCSGLDKREIMGIECELIAAFRKTQKRNPACQFSGDLEDENCEA